MLYHSIQCGCKNLELCEATKNWQHRSPWAARAMRRRCSTLKGSALGSGGALGQPQPQGSLEHSQVPGRLTWTGTPYSLGAVPDPATRAPIIKLLADLGRPPSSQGSFLLVPGPKGHTGDGHQLDPRESFTEAARPGARAAAEGRASRRRPGPSSREAGDTRPGDPEATSRPQLPTVR